MARYGGFLQSPESEGVSANLRCGFPAAFEPDVFNNGKLLHIEALAEANSIANVEL